MGGSNMISPEEFIKAWQTSQSHNEVAKKTGLKVAGLTSKSVYYRKKGIPLKFFSRGRGRSLDLPKLIQLAKSYDGKKGK